MTSLISSSSRGHLRTLSLGRTFSSVPSSPASSSRVRITYTSPITHTSPSASITRPPTANKSSFAHAHPSASGSSSTGGKQKQKRFRIDPSSPPPKSGWCSRVYPVCLGIGLGTGMTVWSMVRSKVSMEGEHTSDEQGEKKGGGPSYNLDQVTLISLVGYPGSGKSTQAQNLSKEFKGFQLLSSSSEKSISEAIHSAKGPALLISDNYPTTLQESRQLESTLCPIFVILYFDIPEEDWLKRTSGTSKQYQAEKERLEPMVKHFRNRGNILEISADWNDPNEVWEQVQAKVEQVLELKERGEEVSISS